MPCMPVFQRKAMNCDMGVRLAGKKCGQPLSDMTLAIGNRKVRGIRGIGPGIQTKRRQIKCGFFGPQQESGTPAPAVDRATKPGTKGNAVGDGEARRGCQFQPAGNG